MLETWRSEKAVVLPLSPMGTVDSQVGGVAGGGSEVQPSFCCVNNHLVSPCTSRCVYVRGESNLSSAPLILSAHFSPPSPHHHEPGLSVSETPEPECM